MFNNPLTRDSVWTHADAVQALVFFAQGERAKKPTELSSDENRTLAYVEEAIGNIMQLTTNDLLLLQVSMERVEKWVGDGEEPSFDVYSAACVSYACLEMRRKTQEKARGQLSLFPENPPTIYTWLKAVNLAENIAHQDQVRAMIDAESMPFTSNPDA